MNTVNNSIGTSDCARQAKRSTASLDMLREMEGPLNEVVHMSHFLSDKLESFGNETGPRGQDIISFGPGEQGAFFFAIYDIDNRLRRLLKDFYAAAEVYRNEVGAS